MLIALASPIALFLTVLTFIGVVRGFNRASLGLALLIFGALALVAAAAAAGILSGYADALRARAGDLDQALRWEAWCRALLWAQALGWPLWALGTFLWKRRRSG